MEKTRWAVALSWLLLVLMMATFIGASVAAAATTDPFTVMLSTALINGASRKANGDMVWTPANQADGHQISYRVSYNVKVNDISKLVRGMIPVDALRIEIPLHVLKDRDGNWADTFIMSVPNYDEAKAAIEESQDAIDSTITLGYRVEGEKLILQNFREVPETTKGFVEIGYITTLPTFKYQDYTGTIKPAPFVFNASMAYYLNDTKTDDLGTTQNIDLYFDTKASINVVDKQQPTLVKGMGWRSDWDELWPEGESEANKKNYWYLVWPVVSVIPENTTQYYTLTLSDNDADVIAVEPSTETLPDTLPNGMHVMGYLFAGTTKWTKSNSIEKQTMIRGRTDYVLTRIPKYFIESLTSWTVDNWAKSTVTPMDGDQLRSEEDTEQYAYHMPVFYDPDGNYNGWKRADGAARRNEGVSYIFGDTRLRRGEYSSYALAELLGYGDPADNIDYIDGLDYATWTIGNPYGWTVDTDSDAWKNLFTKDSEGNPVFKKNLTEAEILDAYGKNPVAYDLEDNGVKVFPVGTKESEAVALDPDEYDITSIQYTIRSYGWKFDPDSQRFAYGTVNPFDQIDNAESNLLHFWITTGTDTETEFITVNIKTGAVTGPSAEWVQQNGFMFDRDTARKHDYTLGTIPFPANVKKFRMHTENAHFETEMGAVVNLRVYNPRTSGCPNGTLREKIESRLPANKDQATEIAVLNHADGWMTRMTWDQKKNKWVPRCDQDEKKRDPIWDPEKEEWVSFPIVPDCRGGYTHGKSDTDYVRGAKRDASMGKDAVGGVNNTKKRRYEVRWKVEMRETLTTQEGMSNVEQSAGSRFYDLLPVDSMLDTTSVRIYDSKSGTYLPDSSVIIRQEGNFRNSGRTMVTIETAEPGTNLILTMRTLHPWDSITDINHIAQNWVAYETGNANISGGAPDDASGTSGDFKTLMSGLDPACNGANRFRYSGNQFDVYSLQAAATGLSKHIRTLEEDHFSKEASVLAGEEYIYRLRLQADSDSQVDGMILFDKLECDTKKDTPDPSKPEEYVYLSSQWRGQVKSIDLSNLKRMGIAPVVYYTEVPVPDIPEGTIYDSASDEDVSKFDILKDMTGWKRLNDGDDVQEVMKNATAFAVDMRFKKDSSLFLLDETEVVTVQLHMLAPEKAPKDASGATVQPHQGHTYVETYNGALMQSRLIQKRTGSAMTQPMPTIPTEADYVVAADIPLLKLSGEDHTTAIEGVTFQLEGESDYERGKLVTMEQQTDRNGKLTFKRVKKGKYTIRETESTPEWQITRTVYQVVIDDDGELTITWVDETGTKQERKGATACTVENPLTVENLPRKYANFTMRKMSQKNEAKGIESQPIEGIRFKLTGESDYKNAYTIYAVSDAEGNVRFPDLELNTKDGYTIVEMTDDWGEDSFYLPLGVSLTLKVTDQDTYKIEVNTAGVPDAEKADKLALLNAAPEVPEVYNVRHFWDFGFYKKDKDTRERIEGAEFRLTGNALATGKPIDKVATSDKDGYVSFENLQNGTYSLVETVAPKVGAVQYALDPTEYKVKIMNGVVTIEDGKTTNSLLSYDAVEGYTIVNERTANDKLIIIKKWEDNGFEPRPTPSVDIWASDLTPAADEIAVTYVANGGFFMKEGDATKTHYSTNVVFYNKETGEVSRPDTYPYRVPITSETMSEDDSSFAGWYREESCENEFSADAPSADLIKELSKSIRVYADWPIVYDYDYTEGVQQFVAPKTGWYKLEVWGAMGGDGWTKENRAIGSLARGGYGGYSSGYYYMEANTMLYVIVGGKGDYGAPSSHADKTIVGGYNGGGYVTCGTSWPSGGGGGMTHISQTQNVVEHGKVWDPDGTIIVAGGGGGTDDAGGDDGTGGSGGGQYGQDGYTNGSRRVNSGGGKQNVPYYNDYTNQGNGQDKATRNDDGGGGAGWYGGRTLANDSAGGGGGSGYVSPLLRNTLYGSLTTEADAHSSQTFQHMPTPNGFADDRDENGKYTYSAPENGFARITYTGLDDGSNEGTNAGN